MITSVPNGPWETGRVVRAAAVTAGCAVGLVAAAAVVHGRSGAEDTDQVGWVAAGVALVMVTMYVHAGLFLNARRAIGNRRAALISDAVATLTPPARIDSVDLVSPVAPLVTVASSKLYHSQACPLVEGRHVVALTARGRSARDLDACGICLHGVEPRQSETAP